MCERNGGGLLIVADFWLNKAFPYHKIKLHPISFYALVEHNTLYRSDPYTRHEIAYPNVTDGAEYPRVGGQPCSCFRNAFIKL